MPIKKSIHNPDGSRIFIWEVTETEAGLRAATELSDNSLDRLSRMASSLHRRGFLSIRHLLHHAGYRDKELYYDTHGKPHLEDGTYISITHSHHLTGIALHERDIGIDIEKMRDKITRIAPKFIGTESEYLGTGPELTAQLTTIWGGKESIYKILSQKGLSFRDHCHIDRFRLCDGRTHGCYKYKGRTGRFSIAFMDIMDYVMVYATTL